MTRSEDEIADEACFGELGAAVKASTPPREIQSATSELARAAAGVLIHRNNVRLAYQRVLQEAFPVVHRLVGDDFFRLLAHEYFNAHPPSSPLVARYGDSLPRFLDGFEPSSRLPYLADMARLEIAWLQSYHAADAKSLDVIDLVRLIDNDANEVRLSLHPSLRLIKSPHPVHAIWLQNRAGESESKAISPQGECVMTVRPEENVLTRTVATAIYIAIDALKGGVTLGGAVECALNAAPSAPVVDVLTEIFAARIVTAVHPIEAAAQHKRERPA
jgi:hypothetical protein